MANREINVQRTYYLGQFKNIKFGGAVLDLPKRIWMNPEAMDLLGTLMLVSVERDFRKYQDLIRSLAGMSLEESLASLNGMRDETYREIQKLLTDGEVKNNLEGEEDE